METNRVARRAELAAEIQRRRSWLNTMKFAQHSHPNDQLATRMEVCSNELAELEREYHALNVQQIRDELENG
jgi:hypothetical protein